MLLNQDHGSLLILIDADYQNYEEALKSIALDETLCCGNIALFNLNESAGIEKKALSQNIRGFFYKDDQLDVFLKGIRSVFCGEIWVSRKMLLKYVMDGFCEKNISVEDKSTLTCRELEILSFVCTGSTNEEIANKMCISTNTVKTHLYKIFKKIHVENRLQAALWTASNL
jgi:LuxR family transcriptional regulator of csgAB operon